MAGFAPEGSCFHRVFQSSTGGQNAGLTPNILFSLSLSLSLSIYLSPLGLLTVCPFSAFVRNPKPLNRASNDNNNNNNNDNNDNNERQVTERERHVMEWCGRFFSVTFISSERHGRGRRQRDG